MTKKQTKAQLIRDLEKAKEALEDICQVVSRETKDSHPEKVGAVRSIAGRALLNLGDATWRDRFEAESKDFLDYLVDQYSPASIAAKPLLKVA